jgi:vanillate monooxygenase
MPGQRVRGFPAIRSYPLIERYGFIWMWPGEKERATEASIPTLKWYDNSQWAYGGGMFHIQCDYRLMIDNLMELTHETYVHAGSIEQKEIDDTPCKTTIEGNEIITSRFMENIQTPPFWKLALRGNHLADDVPVDRWQLCRFTPPSNVMIEVGVAHAGHGGYNAPAEHKVSSMVVDFITPTTETSIWYFWGIARNFNPSNKALTVSSREGQHKIFSAINTDFDVKIASTGALIRVGVDQTVVQALAAAGIELQTSCEQGVCGTCLTGIKEGIPDHRDMYLSGDEQAVNDQFTPCCSRAISSILVLDL